MCFTRPDRASGGRRKCATLVGQCAISPFIISTSPCSLSLSLSVQLPSDSPPVYPFIPPPLISPSHYTADLRFAGVYRCFWNSFFRLPNRTNIKADVTRASRINKTFIQITIQNECSHVHLKLNISRPFYYYTISFLEGKSCRLFCFILRILCVYLP